MMDGLKSDAAALGGWLVNYLDGREVLAEERVDDEPVGEGAVAHDERVACV